MPTSTPGTTRPLTALDVYCGVGGLSLGLAQAGFRLLGGVDHDPLALETHRINFPGVPTVARDLFTAGGDAIRDGLGIGQTRIDLLAGGPPCQGFSSGGVRVKSDPRNQGILAFARLVLELRPRYFLMENVRGFLFKDHDALREKFVAVLRAGGYTVLPFRLLNAVDFGVPQRRIRAFVIGGLAGEKVPEYPKRRRGRKPTVRSAITDLLDLDDGGAGHESDVFTGRLGKPTPYSRRLRVTRDGKPSSQRVELSGCLRSAHSPEVVRRFAATPAGGQESISHFFRLCWQGISPTIRAGTGPDHGSHTAPRPIHPERPRSITVREAARLHSFPDWFRFSGTRWHGFRQIGNSVPPLLGKAVALQVMHAARSRPNEGGDG